MTIATAILLLLAVISCSNYAKHPFGPEASLYKIGGPKEIADWTLAQHEYGSVVNGIFALGNLEADGFTDGNKNEAQQSRDGLDRIHDKLKSGWITLDEEDTRRTHDGRQETVPLSEPKQAYVERLLKYLYQLVADTVHERSRDTEMRDLFNRMKPDSSYPDRLKNWNEAAKLFSGDQR